MNRDTTTDDEGVKRLLHGPHDSTVTMGDWDEFWE